MRRRAFLRLLWLTPLVGPAVVKAAPFPPATSHLGGATALTQDLIAKAIAKAASKPRIWLSQDGRWYYVVVEERLPHA